METLDVKNKLLKHIELADEQSLKDLYDFAMRNDMLQDPFKVMPKEAQELLLNSIAQAESGQVVTNDEFREKLRKKYSLPDL